jgi:N-acetylneuraminic acid mutarotase
MKSLFFSIILLLSLSTAYSQWKLIDNGMKTPRGRFSATRIGNTVYIIGGRSVSTVIADCEKFDVNAETFTSIGTMNEPRLAIPVIALPDNKLYMASGISNLTNLMTSTCEIYDPTADSWTYTTNLKEAREGTNSVRLNDSLVLIVGGALAPNGPYRRTCELYNINTKVVTFTDSLSIGQFCGPIFLDTGTNKVTYMGGHYNGQHGTWVRTTEEYDIATHNWSVVGNTLVDHGGGNEPVVLPNGDILVAGGDSDPKGAAYAATDVIEIYTPSTHTWRTFDGKLRIARTGGFSAYLGGDSVIVVGGYSPSLGISLDDCEIINLKTGAVTAGPKLNQGRSGHWLTVKRINNIENPCCQELKIYVFGGENALFGGSLSSCEVLTLKDADKSPLIFNPTLSVQGSTCTGIDTAIVFKNTGCSAIIVDSVIIEGLNATVTGFPAIVKLDEEGSFPVKLSPSSEGTSTGRARIYYHSTCSKIDTSITITANFSASSKGSIRPIISDVPNGRDTIEMPLYLVNNTGDIFNTFEITLGYNKNLIEAIAPRFDGTLAEGAPLADVTSTATGATIFVPQTIALSIAKPLCILRFASHLSDTTCTTVRLEAVTLEDASGNSCVYVVNKDSALICKALGVYGENERSICTPSISELRFDGSTRTLGFSTDGCTSPTTAELYDILGKQILTIPIQTGIDEKLHVPNVADGVYCLVVQNTYGASIEKIIIKR